MLNRTILQVDYPYWVDDHRCSVCGLTRKAWKRGARGAYGADLFVPTVFDDGVQLVRLANGGFDSGGGWRSRGSVLWAMAVIADTRWLSAHTGCEWANGADDGADGDVGYALADEIRARSELTGAPWDSGVGVIDWSAARGVVELVEDDGWESGGNYEF